MTIDNLLFMCADNGIGYIDYDGKLIEKQKVKMEEGAVASTVEKNYIKDFIELLETILTKLLFEKEQNV